MDENDKNEDMSLEECLNFIQEYESPPLTPIDTTGRIKRIMQQQNENTLDRTRKKVEVWLAKMESIKDESYLNDENRELWEKAKSVADHLRKINN